MTWPFGSDDGCSDHHFDGEPWKIQWQDAEGIRTKQFGDVECLVVAVPKEQRCAHHGCGQKRDQAVVKYIDIDGIKSVPEEL